MVDKINEFRLTVKDPARSVEDRRFALRFLIHCVEGMHMPLHVGENGDKVGPISEFEPFSIMSTEPPLELRGGRPIAARSRTPLGTLRKARSPIAPRIGCGKAGHGRDGQAFVLVESGVVDRATANSLPWTAAGRKQDDQAAETKPPSGSCSRILDQSLGPTRARSSKNWPLE